MLLTHGNMDELYWRRHHCRAALKEEMKKKTCATIVPRLTYIFFCVLPILIMFSPQNVFMSDHYIRIIKHSFLSVVAVWLGILQLQVGFIFFQLIWIFIHQKSCVIVSRKLTITHDFMHLHLCKHRDFPEDLQGAVRIRSVHEQNN